MDIKSTRIPFDEFVTNFLEDDKKLRQFFAKDSYDEESIDIEYYYDNESKWGNDARVILVWRSDTTKWYRTTFNGSSPFAMWWSQSDE